MAHAHTHTFTMQNEKKKKLKKNEYYWRHIVTTQRNATVVIHSIEYLLIFDLMNGVTQHFLVNFSSSQKHKGRNNRNIVKLIQFLYISETKKNNNKKKAMKSPRASR